MPAANAEFWATNFRENRRRDTAVLRKLHAEGWRTLIVWEHSLAPAVIDETAALVIERVGALRPRRQTTE
jgi:G:T-mismatch repair DNA endonuclease (very short patch repair protein)